MNPRHADAREFRGFLHWVLPIMLGMVAATALLSGRDLSPAVQGLAQGTGLYVHPAAAWLQRIASLMLMLISAERLLHHVVVHRHLPVPLLAWAMVTYWAATVAAPALFGSHPKLSHEYLYALVIGLAALVATPEERERVVGAVRNALFLFMLASAAVAVVKPTLVLELHYTQGLLPGVPRLAGLAPHPVALGILAQTFLLCLWVRPFRSRWLTLLAWGLGLAVLFLAQSKTSWIAFLLCSGAMLAVRRGGEVWRRMGDPREGAFGIVVCLAAILVVGAVTGVLLFSDLHEDTSAFLDSTEGAQLMTLTGRDQIWAIAMEEWRASPVFGYGPNLWDDDFRASIHMPNATHGHNQFMDTLARSGTVGATALLLYAIVLLVFSLRAAKATGGLSIALFIALALRSVSEVPLEMLGYGNELFTHLLLIITLASANLARPSVRPASAHPVSFRTAA